MLFLASIDDILKKFQSFPDTRVLFAAEQFCWPDTKLASQYPNIEVANPYLNSGGFIGNIVAKDISFFFPFQDYR